MKTMMKTLLLMILLLGMQSLQARSFSSERWIARNDHDNTSLDSAVSRARRDYRGRVISAETDEYKGRKSHKIRILTEKGTVRRIRVDPETGQYLPPPGRR
ncbi:MAG: hypothetical protein PVG66_01265 [Chromatiales bacterium]|jgi:uncharacterized membrane protein YkoI